jgi:hypothetical protein
VPSSDQILIGLKDIVNNWRGISIFWHFYFGIIVVALLFGTRLSKRVTGLLLGLPILSVSAIAWISANPFNGLGFAIVGILTMVFSARLPLVRVSISPTWMWIPGVATFTFGWIYPHFLDTLSFIPYLYAAPIGLIPCPTLSIVIGMALLLNGLGSRAVSLVLGLSGFFYGLIGVFKLGMEIDLVLLLGAILFLIYPFVLKKQISAG